VFLKGAFVLSPLSVQLRTTPRDSTGVPHILEHTVLCGSERFPCRDPFFKMLNRSLATFMNAFTGNPAHCPGATPTDFSTRRPLGCSRVV